MASPCFARRLLATVVGWPVPLVILEYNPALRKCKLPGGGPAGGSSLFGGTNGSSPLQRQDGHLGSHAEAEAKAEADALVDVEVGILDAVHAGGETPCLAAEGDPAKARPVDLPSVRVTGKHQVAAAAIE